MADDLQYALERKHAGFSVIARNMLEDLRGTDDLAAYEFALLLCQCGDDASNLVDADSILVGLGFKYRLCARILNPSNYGYFTDVHAMAEAMAEIDGRLSSLASKSKTRFKPKSNCARVGSSSPHRGLPEQASMLMFGSTNRDEPVVPALASLLRLSSSSSGGGGSCNGSTSGGCSSSSSTSTGSNSSSTKDPRISPFIQVMDQALPPTLLKALQQAFVANTEPFGGKVSSKRTASTHSKFYEEHGYPTSEFFSYNFSHAPGAANTLLHQVATHLRPHVEASFPHKFTAGTDIESVEFWCHARDSSEMVAHQLHFDSDEEVLKAARESNSRNPRISYNALHPMVSCVLYLTDYDTVAGKFRDTPTLVLDQTLGADSVASEGWLCRPAQNRLLMFDGRCLHGVVPYQNKFMKEGTPHCNRVTLMMGWWAKSFCCNSGSNSSSGSGSGSGKGSGKSSGKGSVGVSGSSSSGSGSGCGSGSGSRSGGSGSDSGSRNGGLQGLGPNMPLPRLRSSVGGDSTTKVKVYADTRRGVDVTWPELLEPVPLPDNETQSQPVPSLEALTHIPGPIWIPLQTATSGCPEKPEMADDDVEFISIEQLNALRNAAPPPPKTTAHAKKKQKKNTYEFLGKWFLKDLSEIRSDVLQPPFLKVGKKIELIDC